MLLLCLIAVTLATAPEQIHLALAGSDSDGVSNGMSVMWYTAKETQTSTVQYGSSPSSLSSSATGSVRSYLPDFGFHHVAVMEGLQANSRYYYRVGDSAGGWSSVLSFTSAPSSKDATFAFSMFGDMGWLGSKERPMELDVGGLKKNWSAVGTRTQIEKLKDAGEIDGMWILGDIAYADDAFGHKALHFGYEECYNGFMNWFQNVSSIMPMMVSPGNHESECHSPACDTTSKGKHLSNFSAYNGRFAMPSKESGGVTNMWYSFNYGPVHFVSLNTETDFPGAAEENKGDSGMFPAGHFAPNGTYLKWLEADLKAAAANKDNRPWIIAGGHRPFPEIAKTVEAMFQKYGVDMYFAGHSHSYKRTVPSYAGKSEWNHDVNHYIDAQATTYIVVGGAGCDEMENLEDPYHPVFNAAAPEVVPFGAEVTDVATSMMASGVLRVMNASTLQWKLYRSYDGTVLDELYLSKSA